MRDWTHAVRGVLLDGVPPSDELVSAQLITVPGLGFRALSLSHFAPALVTEQRDAARAALIASAHWWAVRQSIPGALPWMANYRMTDYGRRAWDMAAGSALHRIMGTSFDLLRTTEDEAIRARLIEVMSKLALSNMRVALRPRAR